MPLLEDRHICILPQEKAESPSGQISQLKICQLLSARPSVVFLIELNGGNQTVTIDLPESLHTSSSVTADEYPYIEFNIPTSILEEQDCTSLPLGGKHDTPTITQPKAPWKPRITLAAEVNNLIDQGMMDNYDQESEHSITAEVPTTEVDTSQPLKTETSVLTLDTSSHASATEMKASMESNPISVLLTAVAHSSHSSSPIGDLSILQSDVHLAVTSMFTAKRSSELEIQCPIWDFEASIHQSEAEAATTNEKAKVAHSRRDLKAKVKCAKAMMKAKYDYCMTVQKARAERCTELEESEATFSESPQQKCGRPVSPVHHTPPRTNRKYAGIRNMRFKGGEQESPGLLVCTPSSPTLSPTITEGRSPFFVLPSTGTMVIILSIHHSHPNAQGGRAATLHYFPQNRTPMVPSPKR